jgi:DNA polymerase (family 10)
MDSRTAAHALSEIAAFLGLHPENRFRARAYSNAAKAVLALNADDLTPILKSGELANVRGLGKATLGVLTDLIEQGESNYLDQLRQQVPEGVVEMMHVPGLTPVKVQEIYEALGVQSIDELEAAARDGRLAKVRGFGEKTAANLLASIEFMRRSSALMLYPRAAVEAARLLDTVRRHPDVSAAAITGAVRRHNEVADTVEIVAAVSADPESVAASFTRTPGVSDGKHANGHASIRYVDGVRLELHCVTVDRFPVALWRTTGNTAHVHEMAAALAARGFTVDHDLIRDQRGERVPIADEEALYALLELAHVPAELREGMGELAAASGALPRLVTASDVRGILHCHSTYSDGHATIPELVAAARAHGWSYIGLSDHSQSAFYAGGMSRDAVARQHDEIDALNATTPDVRILKGIEADILANGHLDYDDDTLDRFDYVIGSVHSRFRMSESEMTARILTALEDPRLTILGHPTGRLLLTRDPYPMDMDAVLEKAAGSGVALELNADPKRLDLDWRYCRRAKELGIPIEIGPDAHSTRGLDCVHIGVGMARKGWLEAGDILNTRSADDVVAFATARRERAYERWNGRSEHAQRAASSAPDDDIPF